MDPAKNSPARWQKKRDRLLAATRILELRSASFHHPGRSVEKEFVVIAAPDWVVTLGLTPRGELVLANQFRFGTNDFSLELPGGIVDLGEDPVSAGRRELAEETGFGAEGGVLLGTVHPNPAIQNNSCHIVLLENVVPLGPVAWDPDEEIEVRLAPVPVVLDWARGGAITHALSLNALLLFEPRWLELTKAGAFDFPGDAR